MIFSLRQLNATDAKKYQQLRLVASQNNPQTFDKSDSEELNTLLDFIAQLTDNQFVDLTLLQKELTA